MTQNVTDGRTDGQARNQEIKKSRNQEIKQLSNLYKDDNDLVECHALALRVSGLIPKQPIFGKFGVAPGFPA